MLYRAIGLVLDKVQNKPNSSVSLIHITETDEIATLKSMWNAILSNFGA
jgi:hypothetical protein